MSQNQRPCLETCSEKEKKKAKQPLQIVIVFHFLLEESRKIYVVKPIRLP